MWCMYYSNMHMASVQKNSTLHFNFFMLQLLSLYSPVFKELFANAEKGIDVELPVVKLENESATDIRSLLDMLYPDTNQVVNGMSTIQELNSTTV